MRDFISNNHDAADWVRWLIISLAGSGVGFVMLVALGWFQRMFRKPTVESFQPRHVTFAALGFILLATGVVWARLDSLGEGIRKYELVQLPGLLSFWISFYYIRQFILNRGERVVSRKKDDEQVLVDRVYEDEAKEVSKDDG